MPVYKNSWTKSVMSVVEEPRRQGKLRATSINDSDGTKLIIATHTFPALVTSSLRLDLNKAAEVGPTTSSLILDKKDGKN